MSGRPTRWLLVILLIFFGTRGYILWGFQPRASDASVYFGYACRAFDLGETPYAGDLRIEFPPVAWWTMASAYALTGGHVSVNSSSFEIAANREHYMRTFRTQMAVCDVIAFALLLLTVRRHRPEWLAGAALAYIGCTSLLAHPLYDRLDMGLLLLFVAAAYCLVRGIDDGRKGVWWTAAACGLLGLGGSYKIIPIVALPFVLLGELMEERGWRGCVIGAACAAAGIFVPLVIQYQVSGPGVFNLLGFHVQRGVQLESTYATIMAVGHVFGAPINISLWEGGADLAGAWAAAMKPLSTMLLGLFLGGLGVWSLLQRQRYGRQRAYRVALLAVVGAVALSKVLSPQYLIWAIPLEILLAVEVFASPTRAAWFGGLLLLIAGVTTWVFPYHYFGFPSTLVGLEMPAPEALLDPSPAALAAVGLRNAAYLAGVLLLAIMTIRGKGLVSSDSAAAVAPKARPTRR